MDQSGDDWVAADRLPVNQKNNGLPVGRNLNRAVGQPAGDQLATFLPLEGFALKPKPHAVRLRSDFVFCGEKDPNNLIGEKIGKRAENGA